MFTVYLGLRTTYGEFQTVEEAKSWAGWLKEFTGVPIAEVREK